MGDGTIGWIVGVTGLVTAIGTIVHTLQKNRYDREERSRESQLKAKKDDFDQRERERSTSFTEMKAILEEQRKEADRQDKIIVQHELKIAHLSEQHARCMQDHTKTQIEYAKVSEQLKYADERIRQLQAAHGLEAPPSQAPVTITAGADGTIVSASPSAATMFHYLDTELIGKQVDLLIGDEYKERHRTLMARIKEGTRQPPTGTAIVGMARGKEGKEIPVTVTLHSWKDDDGRTMITAEIMHRRALTRAMVGGSRAGDPPPTLPTGTSGS